MAAGQLVRLEEGVRLLLDLTDAQLALPTRPPRANAQVLAVAIELVLIGHFDTHRAAIEAKLRARFDPGQVFDDAGRSGPAAVTRYISNDIFVDGSARPPCISVSTWTVHEVARKGSRTRLRSAGERSTIPSSRALRLRASNASTQLFGKGDHDALWAADVAESVLILVLHHLADEFAAVGQ